MAQVADSKNKKTKSNSSVTNYYPNPLSQFVCNSQREQGLLHKNGHRTRERSLKAAGIHRVAKHPSFQVVH